MSTERPGGDELLSVMEAAVVKAVHPHSVRLAIRDGRLKAQRKGNMYLIRRSDLDAWVVVRHRPKGSGGGA